MSDTDNKNNEDFSFQAEVDQLLKMMVHSVYTEKEIFLRELISNASDACDKLRYEAVKQPDLLGDTALKIEVRPDSDAKTLTICDNGIGMSRDELIANLGTIAKSGTRAFLEQAKEEKESTDLIGQFGVGFYSAFMVADKVDVLSAKAGSDARHLWTSDGTSGFHVEQTEDYRELRHGTQIILHLREDALEFLDPFRIRQIVKTYSDHISFPIMLWTKAKDDDGKEFMDEEQLNSASALWMRSKSEISEDEYKSFYADAGGQFDEPKLTIHYRAEGRHEYSVLLFVPTMRPFDLYDPDRKGRVKLYVRRVFITDQADLLPAYMRFVRGVIDSEDMPLNISREMLQNNPIVASIRKAVTNRMLNELGKLAEKDADGYDVFWETFGSVLKEGLYEDPERRDQLFDLARFRSINQDGWISLKSYVENFKENQTAIYYLTGDNLAQLKASPQLEGFKARGLDVLLLTDPVDNFWVATAAGYDGKPFQSVTQGQADFSLIPPEEKGDEEKADTEDAPSEAVAATVVAKLKTLLEGAVSDVRISDRLVDSPACLVAPAGGPDRAMEKILSAQSKDIGVEPVLEINKTHALVKALASQVDSAGGSQFDDIGWLLFDQARILEGGTPQDPARFAERMNRLVMAGLG